MSNIATDQSHNHVSKDSFGHKNFLSAEFFVYDNFSLYLNYSMPQRAPPGFISVADLRGPSVEQVVFEIMICSRPLRLLKRACMQNFVENESQSKLMQLDLSAGYYYKILDRIFAVTGQKNIHLPTLRQCRAWLNENACQHAPLEFELGMVELLYYLECNHENLRDSEQNFITHLQDFYWRVVYPHFFIGTKLTQLSRQQFDRQSDTLEHTIHRQYVVFAKSLIQKYHKSPFHLGDETIAYQTLRHQRWHDRLRCFINRSSPLPPVEWIKASVNRSWKELSFFKNQEMGLCVQHRIDEILNEDLRETKQMLALISNKKTPVIDDDYPPCTKP